MANTDNECKDLEIKNIVPTGDMLELMMGNQEIMQTNTYGYDYNKMNLADLKDYLMMNNHALVDELHEMLDAVGGINDGIGNAVWKPWKSAHDDAKFMHINDHTINDRKELIFEVADILCFFMNIPIALGISPQELFNVYMAKAKENQNRQDNNY